MFININTSRKRSRIPRSLQLVHVHLTDLRTYFPWEQSLGRRNVILFFFDSFLYVESSDRLCFDFGDTVHVQM